MAYQPPHKAYFWQSAPLVRVFIPFALGIAVCYLSSFQIPLTYTFGVALLLLVANLVCVWLWPTVRLLVFCSGQLALFAIGFGMATANDVRQQSTWLGYHLAAGNRCVGVLTADPVERENTWKVRCNIIATATDTSATPLTGEAIVYLPKDSLRCNLTTGDTVALPMQWERIANAGNPFEFDYAGYEARYNVWYRQYCSRDEVVLIGKCITSALPTQLRRWCIASIKQTVADKRTAGLLQAILIGDETDMDNEVRTSFAATGIVHILAISGGNIAIFFASLAFLFSWVRHKKHDWLKYLLVLPVVWLYVLVAGAGPSAVRAVLMFSLLAIGIIADKGRHPLNQLFGAATVMLCCVPQWLFSLGFQLSFLAVLSLIALYPAIYRIWEPKGVVLRSAWKAVAASMAAEVLVAPLILYHFHSFPLVFPIASIVAALYMEVFMLAGFGTLLLVLVYSPAAIALGSSLAAVSNAFIECNQWLRKLNPEALSSLYLSPLGLPLVYIIIYGFSIWLLSRAKLGVYVGLTATCVLAGLGVSRNYVVLSQQRLVVYNVGSELCAELIVGDRCFPIRYPGIWSNYDKSVLHNAHVGWGIVHTAETPAPKLFRAGNVQVAIVDSLPTVRQPMDVLIINYRAKKVEIPSLVAAYQPKLIVLGNNFPRNRQAQWVAWCGIYSVQVHGTALHGAYIRHY